MKRDLFIDDNMTYYPEVIGSNTSVAVAQSLMKKLKVRHLPVVDKKKIIGVVSERDLKTKGAKARQAVNTVMIMNPFRVKKGAKLANVALKMAEKKFGCALVENSQGEIVGIFTTTDALLLLSKVLKSSQFKKINWEGIPEYMI